MGGLDADLVLALALALVLGWRWWWWWCWYRSWIKKHTSYLVELARELVLELEHAHGGVHHLEVEHHLQRGAPTCV